MGNLRNFRITIEQPRVIDMKQDSEVVVDTFTTFVYGVKNQAEVRAVLTTADRLKALRKQGLRITKPQMERANLVIERL